MKRPLFSYLFCISAIFFLIFQSSEFAHAARLKITAYQKHLNPRFKLRKRKYTKYIVIHSSEAGKRSTLRTLSYGKRVRRYWTKGGHAHYMIDRGGKIYRIMNHRYRADHAGLSIWNGLDNLSSYSIGIELVGFHYDKFTDQQYRSLRLLLKTLKGIYKIPDKNVLAHGQVSYGRPNRWFKRPHRGRKKCALNFIREKAGLKSRWLYDPDVKRRKIMADPLIANTFYRYSKHRAGQNKIRANIQQAEKTLRKISNVISKKNTAWSIAGEDFDNPMTLYILPNGKKIRGDHIGKEIGWGSIPKGTQLLLNHPIGHEKKTGPIFKITNEFTAWSFAGKNFNKTDTIYFLPNGKVRTGNRIHDWDSLPLGTKIIVGFSGPFPVAERDGRVLWNKMKGRFSGKSIVFHLGTRILVSNDQIAKRKRLPKSIRVYIENR